MKKDEAKPGPISRPTYVPFFAEPQIGNITTGIWPSHYGENYKLTEYEQKKLRRHEGEVPPRRAGDPQGVAAITSSCCRTATR